MLGSIQEHIEFLLLAFSSIFFIVDPIACIPTFLALTAGRGVGPSPAHGETRGLDLFHRIVGLCIGAARWSSRCSESRFRRFASRGD